MWEFEANYLTQGFRQIAGVDEAGAGPLAGPVVAAAVILPESGSTLQELGLNDSKKLSEKKREALFPIIQEQALCYGIAWISPEEIDRTDILTARMKAMSLALEELTAQGTPADFALIDGDRDKGKGHVITHPHELIVKGDSLSLSIAAASVLAKVTRDRMMVELGAEFPEYGFAKHKGYGTKAHFDGVMACGLCPAHRRTFFRKTWSQLGLEARYGAYSQQT